MTHAYAALPVPGSRRRPLAGARRVADADPDATVHVTLVLRRGADSFAAGPDFAGANPAAGNPAAGYSGAGDPGAGAA